MRKARTLNSLLGDINALEVVYRRGEFKRHRRSKVFVTTNSFVSSDRLFELD
jgi:hypothetical protein